jgi:hypothetical protein
LFIDLHRLVGSATETLGATVKYNLVVIVGINNMIMLAIANNQ